MAAVASTAQAAPKAGEIADGELVRRVRRGDEQAFEQLYHRYHRRITAYIHGMVHDHARAEDVAQDVFVSALRRMRETDRPIAFKPWIYEIAKNACIDQFRRSRRAEEVSYDADEGLGAADYGRLTSSEALPETELESKQSLDHLRGAFGGLSETHHEILVMRELEGLSYREIGERLGMSRPSVESTLFRARRRLTEEYEELVSGARCQRIQSIIADAAGAAVGARDQRRLARHVSHCQPCRRQARLAGVDIPVTPDRPVRARIAAVIPLPLFLRRRWLGEGGDAGASLASGHLGGFAQWSAQLGVGVDPSWFKAAATAATVAVAGVGAGLAGSEPTGLPVGTFNSIIPALERDGEEEGLRAGVRPTVAPALVTTTAALVPAAAGREESEEQAGQTSASAAPGTGNADASAPSAETPEGALAIDGVVEQAAGSLPAADGTTSAGSTDPGASTPSAGGDAGGGSPPELASDDTGSPDVPAPPLTAPASAPASAPAAPDAPTAPASPSVGAGTPAPPDAVQGAAGSAPAKLDGALGGG